MRARLNWNWILCGVLLTSVLSGKPPRKESWTKYSHLTTKSLITNKPKPAPPPGPQTKNDLDDWVLIGTFPKVKIMNKKNRDLRFTLGSAEAKREGFQLVKLDKKPGFFQSEIRLRKGPHEAVIGYDIATLALRKSGPPPALKPGGKGQANRRNGRANRAQMPPPMPGSRPNASGGNGQTKASPRRRYIPKAQRGGNNNKSNRTR